MGSENSNMTSVNCTDVSTITGIVFPILYAAVFCPGILMNFICAWIFFKVPSKSVFIVYLKNTVVADIIMTLTLPFKIFTESDRAPWQMKSFFCRYSAVIFFETMYINIILLWLIGLDRFFKIVKPFGRYWMGSVGLAKKISVVVWIVIFLLSLPNSILSSEAVMIQSTQECGRMKSALGKKWHAAIIYINMIIFWVVFISMTLFYTIISKKIYDSYMTSKTKFRASRKNTRYKVFLVVAVFFLCFAPYHFLRLPYTLSQVGIITDCQLKNRLYLAKEITLWITATNVLMDPLIYVMLCKPFRKMMPGFKSSSSSLVPT